MVLEQALRWGLVTRNVTDLVDKPRPERYPPNVWNIGQIRIFLNAVTGSKYFPVYVVAIYTGMRFGEILGLHPEDVDLEAGIINVKHQMQAIKGQGLVVTDVKTEKSKRPVTIPPTLLEVLEQQMKGIDRGLVFTTQSGKPIWSANVYHQFKKVVRSLTLPDIRFHDLRHTHATLLLQANVNPKIVQERLGHSQISLTLDTYSHVVPSLQEEAAVKFERLLAEPN